MSTRTKPDSIDAYIAACSPGARPILERIRSIIKASAPDATETISYQMPAFALDGVLIYFAAFKHHIGMYPPVQGDEALRGEIRPYQGEKGNLKFPLNVDMPYALIERVVKARIREHLQHLEMKQAKKK